MAAMKPRKSYANDQCVGERVIVPPYLNLLALSTAKKEYLLYKVFNVLSWSARSGTSWRPIPHGASVLYATHRRFKTCCFEAIPIIVTRR